MADQKTAGILTPYLSRAEVWGIALGTAIGWGSLVVTNDTYLAQAGPMGSTLGMLLGAVVMLVIARNYHYMINYCPKPGGAFTYTVEAFDYDRGFLCAWFLALTYLAVLWANVTSVPLFVRYFLGDIVQVGYVYTIFGYKVYLGEALLSMASVLLIAFVCTRWKKGSTVLMLGLGIVTVSVEAYRDQFIKFVKKVTRRSTTYEYRIGNVPYLKADLRKSVIGYVPEGFSVAKQSLYEDYCYINYADTIGHDYSIELTFVDSSTSGFVSIDTEGSELKYIMINDFEAVLNAKDDERQLIWSVNNVICQLAGNIEESEMMRIAEEVEIVFED